MGGCRSPPLISFPFKNRGIMCEARVQLWKGSLSSHVPPLSVTRHLSGQNELATVQLEWLWKVYDDTITMATRETPLLCCPKVPLWAEWVIETRTTLKDGNRIGNILCGCCCDMFLQISGLLFAANQIVHSSSKYFLINDNFLSPNLSFVVIQMFYSLVLSLDFYFWLFYQASCLLSFVVKTVLLPVISCTKPLTH